MTMLHGYHEIIFETYADAITALSIMKGIVSNFGYVSVADLYEYTGHSCGYKTNNRGWINLTDAVVGEIRNGYILMMPPTVNLDELDVKKKKENNMNRNDVKNAIADAAWHNKTGTLQINGARIPVRLTCWDCTYHGPDTNECCKIECEVLTPTKEMQRDEYRRVLDNMDFASMYPSNLIAKIMLNSVYGAHGQYGPQIKDVIFSPPATVVFWKDNTKTVVKAEGEEYDPEKGLAMAIAKKTLGNKHDYYNTFKKWLKKAPKTDAK